MFYYVVVEAIADDPLSITAKSLSFKNEKDALDLLENIKHGAIDTEFWDLFGYLVDDDCCSDEKDSDNNLSIFVWVNLYLYQTNLDIYTLPEISEIGNNEWQYYYSGIPSFNNTSVTFPELFEKVGAKMKMHFDYSHNLTCE